MIINETFIIGDEGTGGTSNTFSSIDNSIDIVLSGNNYDFSVIKTDEIISGGTIPVTNGGVFDYVANAISNVNDFYTTGVTLNNNILYFDRNDALSAYTVSLSSFTTTDNFTTGATFSNSIISFNRKNELSAYTVNLSSLSTDIPNLGNDVWKKSNLTGNTTNKTEDTYRQGSVNLVGASTFFTTGQNSADIIAGTNGANFGHISAGGASVIPFIQLLSNHANGSAGTNNFIGRLTDAGLSSAQMNFSAIKSMSYDAWGDSGRALFRWQDGYLIPSHKFTIGTDFVQMNSYPSTRNDSTNIVNNFLFTDISGVIKSRPISVILSGKSDLLSPSFSGVPTTPTAASGTNTTQIATTEFVTHGLNNKLNNIQAGANISIDTTNPLSPIISSSSDIQKNYYELAKSSIKKNKINYTGSIFYRKFGNIISSLVPITSSKYMYIDFIDDANDDYIKLGEVGYCDILEEEVFTEKLNGDLNGSFNTGLTNSYTTQTGATITLNFTGSSIYLNHYSDNRGGVWLFNLNNGLSKTLSTWESSGVTKISQIFNVVYSSYTITATFLGADPLHPPTGGTARGWFVYSLTNPSLKTFSIYDFGFNFTNKVLILNGSSNKEFAITVKRVGTLDVEEWIPQHTTFGTVFGTSNFLIDNVDFTSLPNRAIYIRCETIELLQDMQAKNPSDSIFLANILTSHLITNEGIIFNGTIEYIEPTLSTNGYVCMLPVNIGTFGTKLLDSFGNSYDLTKIDNSETIFPKKDDLISLCVIDSTKDYFLSVDYLGSNEVFLKNIGNYKTYTNGMTGRFWIQHRDSNINKFYAQTYTNQTIPDNFTHHFNFRLMIGNLKNAYRQLQKNNIIN